MTRYGNGMKEDVTRCIIEVHFGSWFRQCLRDRGWEIIKGKLYRGYPWKPGPYCKQHARQLARKYQEEEW